MSESVLPMFSSRSFKCYYVFNFKFYFFIDGIYVSDWFYILTLYPATLLKSIISSRKLLLILLDFVHKLLHLLWTTTILFFLQNLYTIYFPQLYCCINLDLNTFFFFFLLYYQDTSSSSFSYYPNSCLFLGSFSII